MKIIQEGKAKLKVPLLGKIEKQPVFFNPVQIVARDISVLIYPKYAKDYLDAFAATGARGIRLALEGMKVVATDLSKDAIKVLKENVKLNNVDIEIINDDCTKIMHEREFGAIDIDPYGSPAKFVHCAFFSVKKILGVTATDTAALCGTYPKASLRKYGSFVKKTSIYPEIGIRNLVGFIIREGAKFEIAAIPIFVHAYKHYYRAYFEIKKSRSKVDKLLEKMGYYEGNGPIYLGKLWDLDLAKKIAKEAEKREDINNITKKILNIIKDEAKYESFYIDLHDLSSKLKINPPKIDEILNTIDASRTHFSSTGIRTDEKEKLIEYLRSKNNLNHI